MAFWLLGIYLRKRAFARFNILPDGAERRQLAKVFDQEPMMGMYIVAIVAGPLMVLAGFVWLATSSGG